MKTLLKPRGQIADGLPRELYLETTNRCNLACKTCPQFFGMPEESADLTLAQAERILDQVPVIDRVVLHGIGEPLLNSELPEIIRSLKTRGAHVLFNTNGLLLRGRISDPLIESGLDELRVSVDSATPETYKAIRGIDGLERIFENLHHFADAKARLQSAHPTVSLWITGMKTNVLELPELVRRAAEIGVSEVYLQRLVYSGRGSAVEEQTLFHNANAGDIEAVRRAEALARELGVALRGSGEATASAFLADEPDVFSFSDCRRPWSLMYVTANGNALPCCIAPFTGVPYEDIVLGNVFSQSIEEVWNGPQYQEWRRRMQSSEPPAACAGCGACWSL
jgi:radical SAM protein with 4Fe4S-binding SPASM domain